MADRVQQREAIVLEQRVHLGEELAVMVHANMLEHANRHDAVEAALKLAVVDKLEADAIVEPSRPRLLVG